MDTDERQVIDYLKSWPGMFVSAREVARRAGGKRRFRDEPQWVYPVLSRLVEQKHIETDGLGHYRFAASRNAKKQRGQWISPHVRRILERSGKDFGEVLDLPDEETSQQ
ncbi:MAG: hypothetical protein RLY20_2838 [Verrucomicrobiota bacterium]|jgi:hypothetical protein